MDELPDKSPAVSLTVNRNTLLIVVLLIVVIAAGLLYWNHRVAAHNARVAIAQADFDKYHAAMQSLSTLRDQIDNAANTYSANESRGQKASSDRHDYYQAGNSTDEHVLSLVTAEDDMTNILVTDEGQLHSLLVSQVDAFAGLYGDSETAAFRSDELKADQLTLQGLSYWGRAAQNEKDSVEDEINGRDDSSDSSDEIDNLYEQYEQYATQSTTAWTSMMTDYDALASRLKADTARTEKALNDAKRS
jgi:hypothetical protein